MTPKNQSIALGTMLAHDRPALFTVERPAPLVLGIHRELKAEYPDAGMRVIRTFLKYWCTRRRYYEAVSTISHRVHLDGSLAGHVTGEERGFARGKLERMQRAVAVD